MFTGIVTSIGVVSRCQIGPAGARICVIDQRLQVDVGDSVAVNGVCLTVCSIDQRALCFDVSQETLEKTTLSAAQKGEEMNLEGALRAGDPMGGHWLGGHVDGTATIIGLEHEGTGTSVSVRVANRWLPYLAPKGSIALDGVSLTINDRQDNVISVMVIPHTMSSTILKHWQPGVLVNLEVDMLSRYVVHASRLLSSPAHDPPH